MALTALPMSTISYNTNEFLEARLQGMLDAGKLDDYRFIRHYGEDGDKDHFHVLVYPAKRLDFTAVSKDLREVDITCTDKPLGVMPWRKSSPDHWLMYALHDEQYLANHSNEDEAKSKIRYRLDEVSTPYPQQLERDYRRALALRDTDSQRVINALKSGMAAVDIMYSYDIAPQKVLAISRAYQEAVYASRRKTYDDIDKNAPLQSDIGALFSADNLPDDEIPPFEEAQVEFTIPETTRKAWGENPYKGEKRR